MQEIINPLYTQGRLLKKEIHLMSVNNFCRDTLDIYNENLTNGIVYGLTPIVDKDIITFSKGIVKYRGKVYLINSPTAIPYKETEDEVIIKLSFYDEIQTPDYICQYIDISIDRNLKILDNQIELGRFKLKKGAELRSNYKDLYDFTTEYNTINIVHVLYSGYGEQTLSNLILKYFAEAALEARTQEPMDISFCLLCLNNERVERKVIYNYIGYKLEEDIKQLVKLDNEILHRRLVTVLEKIKLNSTGLKPRRARAQKIIVD